MSILPKLNSYQLFYEQIPLPKHKVASPAQKISRKVTKLPLNVLENL